MGWTIALFVGVSLLTLAVFLAVRQHMWLREARIAEGTVVELIASRGSKGGMTYKPRVEFIAADGSRHEFTRGYSSNPPGFSVGERIKVAYDARDYSGRILTFGQRFGFPVILGSIGAGMTLMALCFILGKNVVLGMYLPPEKPNSAVF
jgi:hypothetical protein